MVAIFFWPSRAPVSAPVVPTSRRRPGADSTKPELIIAESLQAKEDAVRATVRLAEILDRDPENYEAHVELAYRLKELGIVDRAETEFSRALELRATARHGSGWACSRSSAATGSRRSTPSARP